MKKRCLAIFCIRAPACATLRWLDRCQTFPGGRRQEVIRTSPVAISDLRMRHTDQPLLTLLEISRTWPLLSKQFLPETRITLLNL
jgi:hypothetical protein